MAKREPKPGDKYFPLFADEWTGDESSLITIEEVTGESTNTDGSPYGWFITCDDNVGYDCVWCDEYKIWCYSL